MSERDPDLNPGKSVKGGGQSPGKTASEAVREGNDVVLQTLVHHAISPEERHLRISLAAYRRAELRDFSPGDSVADWLEAEREVDAEIVGNN